MYLVKPESGLQEPGLAESPPAGRPGAPAQAPVQTVPEVDAGLEFLKLVHEQDHREGLRREPSRSC